MERGVTVEQVQTAVSLCRSAGIQTGMFLMWGYEGEELSDIEATVEHVKRTDPDIFFTTVAYPIKGTPYFSEVADRVENLKLWKESSDREFCIRNRHSRQFYKFADKLLRSEVELKRLGLKADADGASLAALRSGIAEARAGLQATHGEAEA
jgi:anaerobic magnesium-protoporphyrin IX monomethyl ester cyclase